MKNKKFKIRIICSKGQIFDKEKEREKGQLRTVWPLGAANGLVDNGCCHIVFD